MKRWWPDNWAATKCALQPPVPCMMGTALVEFPSGLVHSLSRIWLWWTMLGSIWQVSKVKSEMAYSLHVGDGQFWLLVDGVVALLKPSAMPASSQAMAFPRDCLYQSQKDLIPQASSRETRCA